MTMLIRRPAGDTAAVTKAVDDLTKAMLAADKARLELQEVPFSAGGFNDIIGINTHAVKDKG